MALPRLRACRLLAWPPCHECRLAAGCGASRLTGMWVASCAVLEVAVGARAHVRLSGWRPAGTGPWDQGSACQCHKIYRIAYRIHRGLHNFSTVPYFCSNASKLQMLICLVRVCTCTYTYAYMYMINMTHPRAPLIRGSFVTPEGPVRRPGGAMISRSFEKLVLTSHARMISTGATYETSMNVHPIA